MTQRLLDKFTCPKCRWGDDFYVDVTATVHLGANGPSLAGDYFAGDDATCVCLGCNYEGSVIEFTNAAEVQS
jgi:hypothetical protein